MAADTRITSSKPPGFSALSIIIPKEDALEPSREKVKAEVLKLELSTAHEFISRFDHKSSSTKEFFATNYPGQEVTFTTPQEGASATAIIKVEGTAKHILKKNCSSSSNLYQQKLLGRCHRSFKIRSWFFTC